MPKLRLLPPVTTVYSQEKAVEVLEYLMKRGGSIAIDTETTGLDKLRSRVLCWSMATEDNRYFIPTEYLLLFDPLFQRADVTWLLANAKFDKHMLNNMGVDLAGDLWDIIVMDAMDDDTRAHGLKEQSYLAYGVRWGDFKDLFLDPAFVAKALGLEKKSFSQFKKMSLGDKLMFVYDEKPEIVENYASCDAYFTYMRAMDLRDQLVATSLPTDMVPGLTNLFDYFQILEVPFTKVLWDMEREGVPVDMDRVKQIDGPMRDGIRAKELALRDMAGPTYNPRSNDELREILFSKEGFGLTPVNYTTSGKTPVASTSEKDLKILQGRVKDTKAFNFITAQLELRHVDKLHGTFIRDVKDLLGPDGRIHSSLNQAGTRTARLSCVAAWTRITTRTGLVPICRINPGDQVWTHNERWRTVTHRFTKGFDHMYDLHLSNGEVLTCTADHKLLLSDGRWAPTGWIINEHLKALGHQPGKSEGCATALPVDRDADVGSDRREAWDDLPERVLDLEPLHASRRAENSTEGSVLGIKDGRQKPHEGKERKSASQLAGGLLGRKGLPDSPVQWEAPVCSSYRDGGEAWAAGDPELLRDSSHRRKYDEQQPRQSGAGYKDRPSHYSLSAGERLPVVEVEKIVYRGCLEVYDITVAEDASYEACGVISHNSSNPNLQNIPIRNDEFHIRSIFVAPDGENMHDYDYPQIQPRFAAILSGCEKMMEAIRNGWDIHSGNAYNMYKHKEPQLTYEMIKEAIAIKEAVKAKIPGARPLTDYEKKLLKYRDGAKTVGLGALFGEGKMKMAHQLGITPDDASDLIRTFFDTYPEIENLIFQMHDYGHETETTHTMLGRIRRLHKINNQYNIGQQKAEERISFNTLIQGTEMEAMKCAMLQIHHNEELRQMTFRLALSVHDELIGFSQKKYSKDADILVKELMGKPFNWGPIQIDLPIPVDPDGAIGSDWASIH